MQYVYLIQSDKFQKIGIANDPQSRLAQLQTGNPYQLRIIRCYGFVDATPVERAIHQAFSKLNVRNEWFLLSSEQINNFENICLLLGGESIEFGEIATSNDVEEEEVIQEMFSESAKFDYAQMFADGWRISVQDGRRKYWNWKRSIGQDKRETIYGGVVKNLPYPLEEMRIRFDVNYKYGESE